MAALAIGCAAAQAQQPAPAGMSLADMAAKRFPQPVAVGTLIGRRVLQPVESQPTLGHVDRVVRSDGQVLVVVDYGGVFGLDSRPIAVPVDGMVLLGPYMEITDFTPKQLDDFPTFAVASANVLPPGEIIRIGLARPSH